MKLFAELLIMSAFFAVGITKAAELKNELFTLRGAIRLIELMKNEIVTRRTRLPVLSEMLISASDKYTAQFANKFSTALESLGERSLADIWHESIKNGLSALSNDCKNELISLGGSIGRYDAELQQAAFERCIEKLADSEKRLSDSYLSNRKMYLGVFGGTGLIAVILLI